LGLEVSGQILHLLLILLPEFLLSLLIIKRQPPEFLLGQFPLLLNALLQLLLDPIKLLFLFLKFPLVFLFGFLQPLMQLFFMLFNFLLMLPLHILNLLPQFTQLELVLALGDEHGLLGLFELVFQGFLFGFHLLTDLLHTHGDGALHIL
jgi:hypothetical protein